MTGVQTCALPISESRHVKYRMVDPDKSPDLAQKYDISSYGMIRVAYGDQSTLVSKGDEESVTNAIIKPKKIGAALYYEGTKV